MEEKTLNEEITDCEVDETTVNKASLSSKGKKSTKKPNVESLNNYLANVERSKQSNEDRVEPDWFTDEIREAIRQRNRKFKLLKFSYNEKNKQKHDKAKRKVKSLIRSSKRIEELRLAALNPPTAEEILANTVFAKVWVVSTKPSGIPKEENFKCIEETLPACKDGELIIEAQILSVDPYMRHRIQQSGENEVVFGSQVARVIKSRNKGFPVGTWVLGHPGWRTHTHLRRNQLHNADKQPVYSKVPDLGEITRSTALGVLGMPGTTAYFCFLEICQPKSGDTVVVNAAAGAVGSIVCQIAKIKGCKVIAFAGSDEKVAWLKKDIDVTLAFNYKTCSAFQVLKGVAPEGVNCYFDNVGGSFSSEVIPHMAEYGRVAICGCISTYNDEAKDVGVPSLASPYSEPAVLWKQLKIEGFSVFRWADRWSEGIFQMKEWILKGKLKYRETITTGFENMPKAFIGLFNGDNIGKAIVKV